jgi:hypothetical protein
MKKLFSGAGALIGALLMFATFAGPAKANTVNCSGGQSPNDFVVHFYLATQTCIINNFSNPDDGQLNFSFGDTFFDPDQFVAFMHAPPPGDVIISFTVNGLSGSDYISGSKRLLQDFSGSIVAYVLAVLSGQEYLMTVHLNKDVANDNITFVSASVSSVPIPAALPLFAAGLGAMGFMGWRRKRRAA